MILGRPTLDELRAVARKLASACDAERVFLFGSRSRGGATNDSDFDLALIFADDADLKEKVRIANRFLWPREFPVDLIPLRHSTWVSGRTLLAREVLRDGVVLYERTAA